MGNLKWVTFLCFPPFSKKKNMQSWKNNKTCMTKSVSFSCQDTPKFSKRQLSVSFSCSPFSDTRLGASEHKATPPTRQETKRCEGHDSGHVQIATNGVRIIIDGEEV